LIKARPLTITILLVLSTALAAPLGATEAGEGPPEPVDIGPLAGADRVVLVELITAGWCPNCVIADGAMERLDDDYDRSELVILAYHRVDDLSFGGGNARMAFYGSPYQPDAIFDGVTQVSGNKGSVQANYNAYVAAYDARATIPSQLQLALEGGVDTTTGAGEVWVNVTAVEAPTISDLRIHAIVFEDDFGPWNGGNGVTVHNWVARQLLTGNEGQALTISSGETLAHHFTFDANAYAQDLDQVGVVAFVQTTGSTKEVLQAGYLKEHFASHVNQPPELEDPKVTPTDGDTATVFRYEVRFRDLDGDAPTMAKVVVDGTARDMATDSTGPWEDWVTYYFETSLTVGTSHEYYFVFSDGTDEVRIPQVDPLAGPTVNPPTTQPTLSAHSVTPTTGSRLDSFTFSVVYTDGENDAPTLFQVFVDGVAHNMTGQGTDYTLGVTFTYTTDLDIGLHKYRFHFGDGVHGARLPTNGSFEGPDVTNMAPTAVIETPDDGFRVLPEDLVSFSASGSSDPEGDDLAYLWASDIDGFLSEEASFDTTLSEGLHNITLSVTDAHDDANEVWVTVLVRAIIALPTVQEVSISPAEPVEGDVVTVTAVIGNEGDLAAEDIEVVFRTVGGDPFGSEVITVETDESVTVEAIITLDEGQHTIFVDVPGDRWELTVTVVANTPPQVAPAVEGVMSGEEARFKEDESIVFMANAQDTEDDELTFHWDFGDTSESSERDPTHTYDDKGTYTVTLTVTDARGDSTTQTLEVIITEAKSESPGFGAVMVVVGVVVGVLTLAAVRRRR
jgi:thiol-disulfide isomerase/thioredoxin